MNGIFKGSPDIEVNGDLFRFRMALTSEDESFLHFFLFQSPVHIHLHFTFREFRFAGAAHPAFAGIGQVRALLQRGIE